MDNYELFSSIGEPFGAGLFELETQSPLVRYANALKRFYEFTPMPSYTDGNLYPSGKCVFYFDDSIAILPHYCNTYWINHKLLKEKSQQAYDLMIEEDSKVKNFYDLPHTVGGHGWTHSFPNYARILKEGLNSYAERVLALPDGDFRDSLLIYLDAVRIYHTRCVNHLKEQNAPQKLILALEKMPYEPASNIYEAIVSLNFAFYIDGCDDIGPLDKILLPYYKGEDILDIVREFFCNVDVNDGWSGTLGPDYNEITRICIRAIHNGRRPNLQLLVKPDMPDWVWEECAKSLATSCGQPAFYNYDAYIKSIRERMPFVDEKDLSHLAFGGCTETMFEGISAVGSDDAGMNIALIFSDYMRSSLSQKPTYESFYKGLIDAIQSEVDIVIDRLNEHRRTRALYRPLIARTLLVDDCISSCTEFNAGGARYVYSTINMAGVVNVIDSLNVILKLVYQDKTYTPSDFISLMDKRDLEFLDNAKACSSYGNDNEQADLIGQKLIEDITNTVKDKECYPKGKFFFVSNQFTTYVNAGKNIPATPDGRACGDPLCDSFCAIHGNDLKGPTALLNSVSKLNLEKVIATPITNIRISKKHLPLTLKPLVKTFFEKGGMQLQVSCLSREEILDAIAHPENHKSLVVRIGGFSEYFNRLTPELKQTVLERTEH